MMAGLEVKYVMIKKIITFNKNDKVIDIAKVMADRQISCVVIVEKGVPIGLITERDIIKRIVAKNILVDGLRAKDMMTLKPYTVTEDENIFSVAKIMEENRFR
jgi:CBS domain-containing protein